MRVKILIIMPEIRNKNLFLVYAKIEHIYPQYLKDYTRDIHIHMALIRFSAALPAITTRKLGVPLCTRYLIG